MGIDTENRLMQREFLAPDAYAHAHTRWRAKPHALVEDYLIRFRGLSTIDKYSLAELFGRFWSRVHSHLASPTCEIYVVVCDDRTNVTDMKAHTQGKRVEAAKRSDARNGLEKPEFYPVGTVFTSEVFQVPAEFGFVAGCQRAQPHDPSSPWVVKGGVRLPDGTLEPICLRRLAMSRAHLCLWTAFYPYIRHRMLGVGHPCWFVFDHLKEGSVWFRSQAALPERSGMDPHDLGEADPALIWWLHFLQDKALHGQAPIDVHLFTADTDLLPLYCYYAPHQRTGTHAYWHYDNEVIVDLVAMAKAVTVSSRLPLDLYADLLLWGGDDLLDKQVYAKGFGARHLLRIAQQMAPDDVAMKAKPVEADALSPRVQRFLAFLLLLYETLWYKDYPVIPLHLQKKPRPVMTWDLLRTLFARDAKNLGKKHRLPSEQELEQVGGIFKKSIVYREQAYSA